MVAQPPEASGPAASDIDENGVDRARIRAMLALATLDEINRRRKA